MVVRNIRLVGVVMLLMIITVSLFEKIEASKKNKKQKVDTQVRIRVDKNDKAEAADQTRKDWSCYDYYNKRLYDDNEEWEEETDTECIDCKCHHSIITRKERACPMPCEKPVRLPGICCPVCKVAMKTEPVREPPFKPKKIKDIEDKMSPGSKRFVLTSSGL